MLIAQISDIHLTAEGMLAQKTINTRSRLEAVISSLSSLSMKPDVIIATGDLADRGHAEAYHALNELRDQFPAPLYVIPGNHDNRAYMRNSFPELPGLGDDPIQYVIEDYPVRIIAIDTLVPSSNNGLLCEERLHWLAERLEESTSKPTMIMMHHVPFRTYIDQMDFYGLDGSENFKKLISEHSQIKRIVCGHLHRSIHTLFGGIVCSVAPGVAFDQALGLGPDGPKGFSPSSPKYDLHLWTGSEFVSHSVTSDDQTPPTPYQNEQYTDGN